jgi:hypothetical protein
MKRLVPWIGLIALVGCSKSAPMPDHLSDDLSARTTTVFNAPSTPQEMAKICDVPMYPGAQAPDNLSRMPRKDPGGEMLYELVLTTKDEPSKVADYFATALKLPVVKGGGGFSIVGRSPHKNDVMIQVDREGGQTVARIHAIVPKAH